MKKGPSPRRPIRVFIADSSSMACQLMVGALQQSRQAIKVMGSATESVQILKGLGEDPSDVAIISTDLKDGPATGFRVVQEARVSYPQLRIIVLLNSLERSVVVKGFLAGADGVFSRNEPFEMLCKCIRAVWKGQIWARSEQLRFVIEAIPQSETRAAENGNGKKLLTKREEELAQLVAEGLTNRDISRQLNLTEHTVRNYLFRIFNKLGTSNRLELALYVLKQRGTEQGADLSGAFFAEPGPALRDGQALCDTGSLD